MTNPQIALEAAARIGSTSPGGRSYSSMESESVTLRRAGRFLQWLEEKDNEAKARNITKEVGQ